MSRLPIRVRLTLAFAVAMAAVLAAMSLLVYVRVGRSLLASVDETLRAQGREAATRARDERSLVDPDVAAGPTLAQVLTRDGAVGHSTPAGLLPLIDQADAGRVARGATVMRTVSLPPRDGQWRLLAVPSSSGGTVVIARSLDSREQTLDHLLTELLIASPLALLLASLAGYGLAAAALRPVEAMRRRAASLDAASAAHLPVPRADDEISRLARTLNDMLAGLRESLEHEQRFVADASHELRTPLALLRTELELALRRPRSPDELEQALRSAAEETERLSALAEDLLTIARAEQGSLPIRPRRIDARVLLGHVAGRFEPRAVQLGRTVHAGEKSLFVGADEDRLVQALSNLVENALRHGAGDVDLFAVERNGTVELHVTDEGPGFPDSFAGRAFDRFSRADEARSRGGAGLGLSIVRLIAEAHGGMALARNREGRGADVWLVLPRTS
jgi:two-component system, OmpR family, sensor kinase